MTVTSTAPNRASLLTPRREQERRAAEFGWRPSGARACPLVVAGKRCQWHQYIPRCICHVHQPLLDHARMWIDDTHDGRRVLTGEPYDVTLDQLNAFAADLEPLGLRLHLIPGPGLWFETTHIIAVAQSPEKGQNP